MYTEPPRVLFVYDRKDTHNNLMGVGIDKVSHILAFGNRSRKHLFSTSERSEAADRKYSVGLSIEKMLLFQVHIFNHCLVKNYSSPMMIFFLPFLPNGEIWERATAPVNVDRCLRILSVYRNLRTSLVRPARPPNRTTLIARATPGVKSRPPWGQLGEARVREGTRHVIVSLAGNGLKALDLRR